MIYLIFVRSDMLRQKRLVNELFRQGVELVKISARVTRAVVGHRVVIKARTRRDRPSLKARTQIS